MNSAPIVRDVFLIGGGHSHVLLIRQWAMNPLPGVRLTLVSTSSQTPYSGMLPGFIAGHYSVDEIHIDLRVLCAWANVRFIEESMIDLDLVSRLVHFDARPSMGFDVLSLDTGSTPDLSVEGAQQHSTPVKPVYEFSNRWEEIVSRVKRHGSKKISIGVVGSGAGGFELITAMRHALPEESAQCSWFIRSDLPLRGRPAKVGSLALESARKQGIDVHTGVDIVNVKERTLIATDGREFALDEILWCTSAIGPAWAKRSGLTLDERGFVATNDYLQSVSHDFVFATGDIGTQIDTPSSKAGVFAVRQAPVLFQNLKRYLLKQSLKRYAPQKDFLSLMATGDKRAIASRGPFAVEADWVWRWKDHIDQTFMNKFIDLPEMRQSGNVHLPSELEPTGQPAVNNAMTCKGCGAKVSGAVLDRVIASLDVKGHAQVISGHSDGADTAIVKLPVTSLVQSVDQLNAIIDDPYLLGKIAALHALSDVVTVNATPHSAQVIVSLPEASDVIAERDLRQVMTGLVQVLNEEGCTLIGGHTTQARELSIGVVINASYEDNEEEPTTLTQDLSDGDVLVLTKPLGIGTVFAGLMQQQASGRDVRIATEAMQQSNQLAAQLLREHGAYAVTDVTGFGLLGHADRLLKPMHEQAGMLLSLEAVPVLPGALQLAQAGVRSSLWASNSGLLDVMEIADDVDENRLALLCDPQTSGGLLAIVPARQQDSVVADLKSNGYADAAVIGFANSSGRYRVR